MNEEKMMQIQKGVLETVTADARISRLEEHANILPVGLAFSTPGQPIRVPLKLAAS